MKGLRSLEQFNNVTLLMIQVERVKSQECYMFLWSDILLLLYLHPSQSPSRCKFDVVDSMYWLCHCLYLSFANSLNTLKAGAATSTRLPLGQLRCAIRKLQAIVHYFWFTARRPISRSGPRCSLTLQSEFAGRSSWPSRVFSS